MKTKILKMTIVVLIILEYNRCNPAVPSASGSQIGLIGELFRSVSGKSNSPSSSSTVSGNCNWDNTNWDACNWE